MRPFAVCASRLAIVIAVVALAAPARAALVGLWKLDDAAGSLTAADSSGSGFTGNVFGGVTFGQPGAMASLGTSAAFTGPSGAKIDVPYQAALNTSQFTAQVWARVDGFAGATPDYRGILSNRYTVGSTVRSGYTFYATDTNQWMLQTGDGANWQALSGPSVVNGQWVHLASTFDGATRKFFMNGQLVASGAGTVGQNLGSPTRIGAGAAEGGGAYWLNGRVDNVSLFNSALTDREVSNQYNSASPYASKVLAHAPVAYWRLGEQAGATAYDSSGTYHGTYQSGAAIRQIGDTPLASDIDTSVDFDGADDNVRVPYSAALHTNTFTLEIWAKVEGGVGTWRSPIMSRAESGGQQQGYNLYARADTNIWDFWTGNNAGWDTLAGSPVVLDEWAHLVASFEPTSGPDANGVLTGIKRFYVNGKLFTSTNARYKPATALMPAFEIGGGPRFNGKLDEVAYYNYVLPVDRVAAHYATARLGALQNPLADLVVFHFDEGQGTTVHNAGLAHASGALQGNTAWTAGLFGGALAFDGSGDQVNVTGFPAGNYSALTVEGWVKLGTQQGKGTIFNEQSGDSIWMTVDVNGADKLDVYLGDTTNKAYHSSNAAIVRGEWTHLAFTYNDALDELKLYVNGQLDRTIATSGIINLDSTVTLGGRDDGAGDWFQGVLDEMAVYSRALSGDEILARFGAGPPEALLPEPSGLVLLSLGALGLAARRRNFFRCRRAGRIAASN